jgi:Tfp pilus assembly protein PilO
MKKLPKEKRNQVILVWIMTLAVIVGWAFMVLDYQLKGRLNAKDTLDKRMEQFADMTNQLAQADAIQKKADEAGYSLDLIESKMANADDTFTWALNTLRDFTKNRQVEIPQISQPTTVENTLLPEFPYKQATLTVAGTAFYHDLGLFVADFENQFPHARVTNLDIQPNMGGNEKLSFRMDIIFLVKPSSRS